MTLLLLALTAYAVDLSTSGRCPGPVAIDAGALTPGGSFVILRGPGEGAAGIPGGPCADALSGLSAPLAWHGPFRADGLGRGGLLPTVPPSADGSWIQVLDTTTCALSPAVELCGGDGLVYEELFTTGVTPTFQCDSWIDAKSRLADGYTEVTLSGSADPVGVSCTDPAVVDALVTAIRDGGELDLACDAHQWTYCPGYGGGEGELFIDAREACDPANCPSPGFVLRPCQENDNWGGAGTNTCGGPTQTLRFELR